MRQGISAKIIQIVVRDFISVVSLELSTRSSVLSLKLEQLGFQLVSMDACTETRIHGWRTERGRDSHDTCRSSDDA